MKSRCQQRQEKYQQNLPPDGQGHLSGAHAYLLHDLVAPLVLIALGHLLIVNDEHGGQQEQQAQENSQKQEAAVHGIKFHRHVLGPIRSDAPCRECVQPGLNMKGNIKNGKEYTYWQVRYTVGYDPGTGKQIQRSISGKTQKVVAEKLKVITTDRLRFLYRAQ